MPRSANECILRGGNIEDESLTLCIFKGRVITHTGWGGTQLSAAQDKMTYFRHWGQWDPDDHPHVLGRV